MKKRILQLFMILTLLLNIFYSLTIVVSADEDSTTYSYLFEYYNSSTAYVDCFTIRGSSSFELPNPEYPTDGDSLNRVYYVSDIIYVENEECVIENNTFNLSISRVDDNFDLSANIYFGKEVKKEFVSGLHSKDEECTLTKGTYLIGIMTTADCGGDQRTCCLVVGTPAPQQPPIKVYLNDTLLDFDVPPIIENGRTLVPLRTIFEEMGMEVGWDSETSSITATGKGNSISMRVNETSAYVNGEPLNMDVAPKVVDGRTLIPVRFIAESLGADVKWDGENRIVYIKENATDVNPTTDNIVINGIDIGYADGSYFTKNGSSCYNTYWIKDKNGFQRCHKHDVCEDSIHPECNCMRYWPTGNPDTCRIDLKSTQCFGFARYCQWVVYKHHDDDKTFFTDITGAISAPNCSASTLKTNLLNCPPATHVRTGDNSHSISIVSTNDDGAHVADCNYNGYCIVRYKFYTWNELSKYLKEKGGVKSSYAWNGSF